MKKFIFTSIMTLVVISASNYQASAWCNSRLGVGLNWNYASGGNSFFCGMFRNGQPGAPELRHSCVATPIYPAQGPCAPVPPAGPLCPPPVAPAFVPPAPPVAPPAAAPGHHHGLHGHAGASQSLRYPSYYSPTRPAVPSQYPVNYRHGR